MENLEKYLSKLETRFPDIRKRLNAGAGKEKIMQLEAAAGCPLPADFTELYRCFDGEDLSRQTGFFAGLEFLPIDNVLVELEFFKKAEEELMAMGTEAVQEAPMCELTWIPFAFDSSRAFLAVDLSPAAAGKAGQIIAVDYDIDDTYLLADSMDEFLGKMARWFEDGILIVSTMDDEEPFLMEASGHLFNSLEELTAPENDNGWPEILLPAGFWQRYYGRKAVAKNILAREKTMRLTQSTIDCALFGQMENLKELILHACTLKNAGGLAKAGQLKRLILAECSFEGEGIDALSTAAALKELALNKMDAAGLTKLAQIKTLKSLGLRAVTGVKPEELAVFSGLAELRLERMGLRDAGFLGKLKNLKKLDLHWHRLNDLDFLPALAKLTEFHLGAPAKREEGLSAVSELVKLKEFIYPVTDVAVYEKHPCLEKIGMAAQVKRDFAVLSGSKVRSFMICGSIADEEIKEIRNEMGKYVKIGSFGQENSSAY